MEGLPAQDGNGLETAARQRRANRRRSLVAATVTGTEPKHRAPGGLSAVNGPGQALSGGRRGRRGRSGPGPATGIGIAQAEERDAP
jgi:hypothetical protein